MRYFSSPVTERMAMELELLRTAVDVMAAELRKRDALLDWYRAFGERLSWDDL